MVLMNTVQKLLKDSVNMLLERAKTIMHMGHKYECLMVRIYPTPKKTYTEKDTTEKMK